MRVPKGLLDRRGSARVVVVISFLVVAVAVAGFALQRASSEAAERERIAEVLDLAPGTTVADIGGGDGDWTVDLARRVGPEGRVFSTEVNPDRLEEIRDAVEDADLENVTVLEGSDTSTSLPEACCEAILLRRVYHHFTAPAAMAASMLASLEPGGRILVIDFEPGAISAAAPEGVPERRGGHGTPTGQLVEEMTAAGFELVERWDDWTSRDYAFLFRRPPVGDGAGTP